MLRRDLGRSKKQAPGAARLPQPNADQHYFGRARGPNRRQSVGTVLANSFASTHAHSRKNAEVPKSANHALAKSSGVPSLTMSEMQLRHMWKVMIGNSPGLEAEIAKLHATHAAKLCYLEYEREFGRERQDRKSRASAVEIARRSVVERRVEVSDPEESHTASGESSSEGDDAARSAPSSTAPRGPPAKATSTAATASAEPRGAREGASAAPSDAAAGAAATDGGGDGIDLRSQNSFGVAVGWLLGQLRGAQPSTHRAHASKAGAEAADGESALCSAPGRILANASAAPPRLDGEIVRV